MSLVPKTSETISSACVQTTDDGRLF